MSNTLNPNRSSEPGLIVVGCPGRLVVVFLQAQLAASRKNDGQDAGKRLQADGEQVAKMK